MGLQKHSKVLNDTVEMLSDEGSYHQLFHAYRDEEALPSGEVLKEIVDLCRAILFPGYYGNARISKQTIRFHTGVNVGTLHTLLSTVILLLRTSTKLFFAIPVSGLSATIVLRTSYTGWAFPLFPA